jgi:APA family basic amino acid/polyamine antiporter
MVPLVPLLGMVSCVSLMLTLPKITWIRFVVWLLAGLTIYFYYGMRHSRLAEKVNGKGEGRSR